MESPTATNTKIAFLYRDEQNLQYFFVCFNCHASYKTASEIIEHVEVHCHIKVIKIPFYEDVTEVLPTPKSEQVCAVWRSEIEDNYTEIDIDEKVNIIQEQPLVVSEAALVDKDLGGYKNRHITDSFEVTVNTAIIDISDDEVIEVPLKTTIINISDEEKTEDLPKVEGSETNSNIRPPVVRKPTTTEFQCKICQIQFHRNITVLSHLMRIHQKNIKLECLVTSCGKQYHQDNFFENHLISHTQEKSLTHERIAKTINSISDELLGNNDVTSDELLGNNQVTSDDDDDVGRGMTWDGILSNYFCKICSFKFLNRNSLERHLENHRMYYRCLECNKFLETPARLLTHSMRKHEMLTKPKCKYCGQMFTYFNSLEKHLFDAHIATKEITNLNLINSLTDSVKNFKIPPINENITPELYQCDLCKKEFYAKQNLESHLLSAHFSSKRSQLDSKINQLQYSRINPEVSEWDEGILIKYFDRFLDENVAINSVDEYSSVDYTCKICDFKCNELIKASQHIYENHMKRLYAVASNKFEEFNVTRNWNISFNNPVICRYCNKIFSQKFGSKGLNQHILMFHRLIPCNQCSLTFQQDIYFHAHYLEHLRTGSKGGTWDYKTLTENVSKFVKEKTISVENEKLPYACRICDKRCTGMNQMSEHVRIHICNIYRRSISRNCDICRKKFHSKREMLRHQRVHPQSGKNVSCSRCRKQFTNARKLRNHEKHIHGLYARFKSLSETSEDSDETVTEASIRPIRNVRHNTKIIVENTLTSDE